MSPWIYFILGCGWFIWVIPFSVKTGRTQTAQTRDRRARWGLLLQAMAYFLLWQTHFWTRHDPPWRIAASIASFLLASAFAWAGVLALGRQWRIDAGLNSDHELVRSGVYSLVRHPIYTSMLCLLLGFGFLIAPLWLLAVAIAVHIAGTEIRVRVEESLLATRFGDTFWEYRRTVPAYIPFLKF